jgi:parallel beta-helix repeat protein
MVGHPFFPSRADGKEKGGTLRTRWWAIATAATLVLLLAGAVQAATLNVGPGQTYTTIQAAVTAALPGDTIQVAAGVYTEVGQIVISKNLSIVGADRATTIVKPDADQSTAWFYVNAGVRFDLSKVTLDGTGRAIKCAVKYKTTASGIVNDNIFTELKHANTSGYAIGTELGTTHVDITNNAFTQIGRGGVWTKGNHGIVSGNTYTGKGAGNWFDYFVVSDYGDEMTISGNTISNNIGNLPGYTSAAIAIWDGAGTEAIIVGNTMTDNVIGVAIVGFFGGTAAPKVVIGAGNLFHGGSIGVDIETDSLNPAFSTYSPDVTFVGVSTFRDVTTSAINIYPKVSVGTYVFSNLQFIDCAFGVTNNGVGTLTATDNWWGSANGPTHSSNAFNAGSQGAVVSNSVTFVPWLNAAPPGGVSFAPVTTTAPVGGKYASIQAGVTAATTGGTVNVAAGTYTGNITIGKQLALLGADKTTTIIDGGNSGVVVTISSTSGVVFKNFTVQHSGTDIASCGGIVLAYATGCTIENNIVTANASGIGLLASSSNSVTDNTISNSARYGIVMDKYPTGPATPSPTNTLHGNVIASSGRDGIYIGEKSDGNTLSDNHVSGATGTTESTNFEANGIYFWKSSDNTLTGNHLFDNALGNGLEMMGSHGNTITGNTIAGNLYGLNARRSASYAFFPNTFSNNTITGNTTCGVTTDYTVGDGPFIATANWWGAASGPGTVGPGTGDKVSANVTYDPWYVDAGMTILSNSTGAQAKEITAFRFDALSPAVVGTITEGTHTVALAVPFGTNVTALVPTITHTGASVNPAGGVARDFTTPQQYIVTAVNGSTQAYTVTVTFGVAGAVTYVDATRPNDSGDGLTLATAKKTIQSGINVVAAGGTVHVAGGTYSESVTITKSLTLQGSSDPSPIIDGGGAGTAVTISASSVTVTGFTIQNASTGIAVTGGTGNTVHLCNILNHSAWGISNTSGSMVDATDNSWGIDSGPSGGAADPVTGRLAVGTGGRVSANVRFDPWTGMSTSVITEPDQGQGAVVTNADAGASLKIDTASGTTDVTIAEYTSPPPDTPSFGTGATYLDIMLSDPAAVTQLTITFTDMSPGTVIYFYRPGTGWVRCSIQTQAGTTITVTVTASTTPTLAELTGTIFAEGSALGDVNGDGEIDVLDVRLCLQIATGFLAETTTADVDGDGDVDLADAEILAEYIIGIITELGPGAK